MEILIVLFRLDYIYNNQYKQGQLGPRNNSNEHRL